MIPPFELMLNDLVVGQTPFTSPFQIAAISGTQVAGYTTDLNFAKVEMNINNLLPLPVTPAFLANNGWRVAPGGYMVIDMTNPDTNIKTRFAWHESGDSSSVMVVPRHASSTSTIGKTACAIVDLSIMPTTFNINHYENNNHWWVHHHTV